MTLFAFIFSSLTAVSCLILGDVLSCMICLGAAHGCALIWASDLRKKKSHG